MEKQETAQTIFITSHYGWDQSDKHVILYIPLPQAKTLSADQCVMTLAPRSIELLIKDHGGYNYNFKLTRLFADLDPGAHKIKLKTSKVVVYLNKKVVGKHWNDVKMKRISDVMYQLQRSDDALQNKFGIVPTDMDDRLLNGYGHQALKEAIKDAFQHETPLVRKAIDEKLAKQNNAYKNNQDPFYLPGLSSSTIKSSTEISVIPPPSDAHHHKHHHEDDDDDDACHDH